MNRLFSLLVYKSYWIRKLALYFLKPKKNFKVDYWAPKGLLAQLKKDGVVFIPGQFTTIAHTISFAPGRDILTTPEREVGTVEYQELMMGSVRNLLWNADVTSLINSYYGRQAYYRNKPVIKVQAITKDSKPNYQGRYHLDGGLHQISLMLLLNDIGLHDTHMEYALGSHLADHKTLNRNLFCDGHIEDQYPIGQLVGKKGDLYIFDAGNGFHRGNYKVGSTRAILHINVVPYKTKIDGQVYEL